MAVYSAVQKHLAEGCEITCRGEQAGVPGDPAHRERIFVMNFALDQALPKGHVIFRGSDAAQKILRGIEHGARHVKGREDLVVSKLIQRFARGALENFAEQYEAEVSKPFLSPARIREARGKSRR